MLSPVQVRVYDAPPFNKAEALRYAGAAHITDDIDATLQTIIDEIAEKLVYKVCFRVFSITKLGDVIDAEFAKISSRSLCTSLAGCTHLVLFAATIGVELDRCLLRYGALSPVKALLLQGIGAERVEGLCDTFCRELRQGAAAHGCTTTARFSPGYGDLPLTLQRDVFSALDPARHIGLTLNDSLLMTPQKSVTAIVGVKELS